MPPVASVVLGVGGGIAAYKAVRAAAAAHRVRARRPGRARPSAALRFVGAPTWAALSGQPVATDVWDDVHEVPHVRLGQAADLVVVAPGHRRPAGQGRPRPRRRPAHQHAATARCPVRVRAGHAHRDVGAPGHRGQRRDAARARRRSCSSRPSAGSPAPTPARAGCPSRPRSSQACAACWPAGRPRAAAAALDLAGRHVVVTAGGTREPLDPVRFLGNRSSGRQGYALARPPLARGAEVTLVAPTSTCPTRPASRSSGSASAEELREAVARRRRRRRRGRDGRRGRRLPAGDRAADQDQEDAPTSPTPVALVRNPDILAELAAATAGRPGQVRRRVRRRDRRRRRRRADPRPGQARAQGLRPARGQRGRRRPGLRAAATTPRSILGADGTEVEVPERAQGGAGRRRAGTCVATTLGRPAYRSDSRCSLTARPPRPSTVARRTRWSTRVPPPVHLRVRHRGPPGQDRRPDQRRDPRRAARARTPRSRVAVETLITTGQVHVAGEVTTEGYADIPTIVRETHPRASATTRRTRASTAHSCGVTVSIGSQSPDIAQGVDDAYEERHGEARRPARPPGRRRPGHDVRLRLPATPPS